MAPRRAEVKAVASVVAYALGRTVRPRVARAVVSVSSVPGVETVTVDGPAIVAVDGVLLREPIVIAPDPQLSHALGPWVLACWCGEKRIVPPNSLHQVRLCRTCQERLRLARRRAKAAAAPRGASKRGLASAGRAA